MKETNRTLTCLCAANRSDETVAMDGCADVVTCRLNDVLLESSGRILDLTVKIRGVQPGKRMALGVLLTELAENGAAESRGLRTMTVPAHTQPGKRDILIPHVRFVLPENLSLGRSDGRRLFSVGVLAHYIDLDEALVCSLYAAPRAAEESSCVESG